MPFAATYRYEVRSVDVRSTAEHRLDDPAPVAVISVPQNSSRALLAGVPSPRQDLLVQGG